ncbi:hypothetical protein CCR75_008019 [Bremia lactucae]|uniref:Uncharacterized protein n=1 Tax=Bremia lactucae TaxID=4779 RepID=A0A976FEV7_BRELC|nr:hypothetical protein CCR75_008019 [Bremia lactucae]
MNDHYRDTLDAEELLIRMPPDSMSYEEGIVLSSADPTIDRDIEIESVVSDQDEYIIVETEPMALVQQPVAHDNEPTAALWSFDDATELIIQTN